MSWVVVTAGLVLTAVWLILMLNADRSHDMTTGGPWRLIPYRNDLASIIGQTKRLLEGRPGGAPTIYALYPAITDVQYALIGWLPRTLLYAITPGVATVLTVGSLLWWAWSGGPPRRHRWLLIVIVSPAVIDLVYLNQFNTALGLAALTLAAWAQSRNRWLLAGAALAVATCRPTNALPVAVALVVATSWGHWRRAAALCLPSAVWLAVTGIIAWRWDPAWIHQAAGLTSTFHIVGVPALVGLAGGGLAESLVLPLTATAAGLLAWRRRGAPLSLDFFAGLLALSLIASQIGGLYLGVFALPAACRFMSSSGGRGSALTLGICLLALCGIIVASQVMVGVAAGSAATQTLQLLATVEPLLLALVALGLVPRPTIDTTTPIA